MERVTSDLRRLTESLRYASTMCDTFAKVLDDGVLFAKNSDRDANESQILEWHPAVTHEPNARLTCTWIEIPQAASTMPVLISRPWWMWGAEMGANAAGVVIGNEAVFTRDHESEPGLLGMDLLRLALERASTAEEATQVIVEHLERYGQGGSCSVERPAFSYDNSFLIADPSMVIVLETAMSGCVTRRRSTEAGLSGATSVADLFKVLRTHADGLLPSWSPVNGGLNAPCVHSGGLLASSQTTASLASDLRAGGLHWATGTAAPCTSIFKPFRIDEPVDLGVAPTNVDDLTSLWWRHEPLHRAVVCDPGRWLGSLQVEVEELERSWLASTPSSAHALVAAQELEERWAKKVGEPRDLRPWFARSRARREAEAAGLVTIGGA
jgi:secernin